MWLEPVRELTQRRDGQRLAYVQRACGPLEAETR